MFTTTGILLLVLFCSAQTKDEKAVADAVEQLRMAMVNPDKAVLEKLTYIPAHAQCYRMTTFCRANT